MSLCYASLSPKGTWKNIESPTRSISGVDQLSKPLFLGTLRLVEN